MALLLQMQDEKNNEDTGTDLYWEFALIRHFYHTDPLTLTWEGLRGYLSRLERLICLTLPVGEETKEEIEQDYRDLLRAESKI